jgi:uncharacterized protein
MAYIKKHSVRIFFLSCLFFFCVPFVHALELEDAKTKGLVGETVTGYLAAVPGKSNPEVNALVNRINDLRRKEYQKIASKNGTAVAVVEKIGAKKAIDKTPAGQFVQRSDGSWTKK